MRNTLLTFREQFNAGSIQGSIFTLVMATFGSGMLILPYSMMASGLAWGTIQLIICGWMGYYSLLTMVKCAIKEKVCSYQELAYLSYGGWFRLLMNAVLFLGNLGTVLMYLKLMSTLTLNFFISNCTPYSSCVTYWTQNDTPQQILLAVIACLLLPLSLVKRLKRLRYLCLMSFLFVVFLCFVVFLQVFFFHPPKQPGLSIHWFVPEGVTDTFPTAVFAFMSHPNILDVFGELRNPSIKRMKRVISATMILVFLCCFVVGLFGYINFAESPDIFKLDQVGGVILYAYMYNTDGQFTGASLQIRMCLIMMALALLVTTPINVIPAKDAIKDLFIPKRCDIFGEPIDSGESRKTNFLLVAITIGLAAGIALLPWTNVQDVMNLIGSSFYAMICLIFPAIFYLRLHRLSRMDHSKVINWAILILMSGFAIYMTYRNTRILIDPASSDTVQ